MKKYQAYKPSGVEWIGDIPVHWKIKPLKYISQITLGKMLTPEDKGGYFLKPYLRSQNIQIDNVDVSDIKEMWFSENELEKYRLNKDDILVNEGGDVGRSSLWRNEIDECYIQNSVNRVKMINGINKYYLFHFFLHHTTGYFNSIVNRVSIPHLTKEKLENVVFIIPPYNEQNQIIQFLDDKTGIIDKLILTKERKIDLLKQQRTSLINQVITKGLDPNVKMKDSDVEWIGEIPEHWEIKPLKYISQITLGKMLTPEDKGGYFLKPYLRSQNIQIDNVDVSNIKEMWFSKNELEKYRLGKEDILVNEGGDVGRSSMWNNEIAECYIQNSVNRVRITNGNNNYYLFHFFLHHASGYFNSIVNRVSIPHLTKEKLESVVFLIPPISEQNKIVYHLNKLTSEIDDLISLEQKKIDVLKEYRQSLISEVITGKIDVRNN